MAESSRIILIVGATSGIGEELARQYHPKGRKVIIAGRRTDKLQSLAAELHGLETIQIDMEDFRSMEIKVAQICRNHPDLDSVILSAGVQKHLTFYNVKDSQSVSPADEILNEININLTGPILFVHYLIPQILSIRPDKPFSLAFVTSGLAYVPVPLFPIYCATKSALHYFAVSLRAQLKETRIQVIEIVPPYVQTALDHAHRDALAEFFGGEDNVPKGMPVGQYVESVVEGLEQKGPDGKAQKVIADGFPKKAADLWVEAYGPMMKMLGVDA